MLYEIRSMNLPTEATFFYVITAQESELLSIIMYAFCNYFVKIVWIDKHDENAINFF